MTDATYFKEKREDNKEFVVGLHGMDSMVFGGYCVRSRGIKPWEKAKYEAEVQRQKNAEFFKMREQERKFKQQKQDNVCTEEIDVVTKEEKEQKLLSEHAQRRWEVEHPFAGYVDTGVVDAWD